MFVLSLLSILLLSVEETIELSVTLFDWSAVVRVIKEAQQDWCTILVSNNYNYFSAN